MFYRFGEYALNTETGELHRVGVPISLERKVFQVLTYLVQQRHRLVTRQELLDTLWPDEFVTDASLTRCIAQLRKVLGDHRRSPQYIKTLHGRGYRFRAIVTEHPAPLSEAVSTPNSPLLHPPVAPLQESGSVSLFPEPSSTIPNIPLGEYKAVTVLCGAFVHTIALTEHLGIESLQQSLRAMFTIIQRTVKRYEGMLDSFTGEDFVILFGVPLSQEDHAQRAVLAAFDLQQHLQERDSGVACPLQMRMGMHTSVVVVGPPEQGEERLGSRPFTMVGEAIPLARQLQYRADPGTILLSETTARLVQGMMQMEAVGSFPGDISSTSLTVYRIGRINPQDASWVRYRQRFRTRFVGREGELPLLYQRLGQVQQGYGQVVVILGEPKIGKSRFLAEFR